MSIFTPQIDSIDTDIMDISVDRFGKIDKSEVSYTLKKFGSVPSSFRMGSPHFDCQGAPSAMKNELCHVSDQYAPCFFAMGH